MATLQSSIELYDAFSAPLISVSNALNMTLSQFENFQRAAGADIDTSSFEAVRNELARAGAGLAQLSEVERKAKQTGERIDENTKAQERFNKETELSQKAYDGLAAKVRKAAAAIAAVAGVTKTISLADSLSNTEARMRLMLRAGEDVKDVQTKIFASANRSRASYLDTMNAVASLGQRAGDAFSSTDEIILFSENLNKLFAVAGATSEEARASTIQLTQALGSGVLRGDELNSVFEQAPNVIQTIADHMNVPIGQIRELASEGKITAQIVKDAMLGASVKIHEEFGSMSLTFGQTMTVIKNYALRAFQPVLKEISNLTKTEAFQTAVTATIAGLVKLSEAALKAFGLASKLGELIKKHWGIAAPFILGTVTALAAYKTALAAVIVTQKVHNAVKTASAFLSAVTAAKAKLAAGATLAQAAATTTATGVQIGFNAALLACPLTWVAAGLLAVVAAIYAGVAAFNKFEDAALSATGIIAGLIKGLWAIVVNVYRTFLNMIAAAAEFLVNVWEDPLFAAERFLWSVKEEFGEVIALVLDGVSAAVNFAGSSLLSLAGKVSESFRKAAYSILGVFKHTAGVMDSLINGVLTGLELMVNGAVSGLNKLLSVAKKIPGVKAGLPEKVFEKVKLARSDQGGFIEKFQKTMDPYKPGVWEDINLGDKLRASFSSWNPPTSDKDLTILDRESKLDYRAAYESGYEQGEAFSAKISDFIEKLKQGPEAFMESVQSYEDFVKSVESAAAGRTEELLGGILDNTSAMRESLTFADEELKYMRDTAEREAINRFTTAEIKVDMSGMSNHVSGTQDLDGIVSYLAAGVEEALQVVAEGV